MNYNRKKISAVLATTLIVLLSLTALSSGVAATLVLPEVNKTVYDPGSGEWAKALTAELNDTLRFKCTITNPPDGQNLTQIRFWDIMDCSLMYQKWSLKINGSTVSIYESPYFRFKPHVLHPESEWNLSDPNGSIFHELYPPWGYYRQIVNWEDTIPYDGNVSACDQVQLERVYEIPLQGSYGGYEFGNWYHVDRVPYTLTLYNESWSCCTTRYFDSVLDWDAVDLSDPINSTWFYLCGCKDRYTLIEWDGCSSSISQGDTVTMRNERTGEVITGVVDADVVIDLVVSKEYEIDDLLEPGDTITIEYNATVERCGVDNNTFVAKGLWSSCVDVWRYSDPDVVTITVPCTVPSGEATDPGGLSKEVYTRGEPVYAVGSGFEANKFVDIYIVPFQQLNDGVAIDTLGIIAGPINVTTDGNGDIGPELIWPNPVPGHYLMIFDDPEGDYNQDRDPLDDFSVVGAAPVVTPLGLVALVGLLSVIATSTLLKRKRR